MRKTLSAVAQALVPAASTLVSRPGSGEESGGRRDESRRGTQECVRHENRRGLRRFSNLLVLVFLALAACRQDMQDQPRYKPLAPSSFFTDGRSARPIPPGTVARDALNATDIVHTGWTKGVYADTIPLPLNRALLERGRERFDIYCSPCHGYLGDGDGMVARRGFKIPPSLHHDRVRNAPPGYLFQVITNGYGGMGDYGNQIPVEDRWAIVAYIRALELSRNATLADLPPPERARMEARP